MTRSVPNLSAVNLNLLTVFDALARAGNVTGAARELGVTQSAVSHSLRELRALLHDPLFVRAQGGLAPTPRAQALAPVLRQVFETLGNALRDAPSFDAACSTRHFSIATADEISSTLLPRLIRDLAERAPRVRLDVRHRIPEGDLDALHRGSLDFLFCLRPPNATGLAVDLLYEDDFSCLVREGHPVIGQRLTLAKYLSVAHVLVTPEGARAGDVDAVLATQGLSRQVYLTTRSFMAAPHIVAHSDLIVTLPTRVARRACEHLPLRRFRPPIELSGFAVCRLRSKVRGDDPGLAWLGERIDAAAAGECDG